MRETKLGSTFANLATSLIVARGGLAKDFFGVDLGKSKPIL